MLPLRILGFLWLMFSPCGAEGTCPSDISLVVVPAEAVQEYGSSLTVNCSSTAEEFENIYWRVGNTNFDAGEYDFGTHNLFLSDYNIKAQCIIQLNESYECSEDLQITVYKNPEVVSSIKHESVKEGETQYDLQCDLFNVAPVQNLIVRWYKNNETIMTNTLNDTTKTPVNKTVTLPINVTRSEHVVQLRCEAQLDFGPHGVQLPVVVSQTHYVSALYAPEMKPLNHSEPIFVSEGENVTLNCGAEGNPPPVFSWTCDGVDMVERTSNLTFAPVNVTTTCICKATNHLGNITVRYHIEMIEKIFGAFPPIMTTPEPETSTGCPLMLTPPKVVAKFGDPVFAVCNTSATDAVGMGWESPVEGTRFLPPPSVSWTIEKLEDWDLKPVCNIIFIDGGQCSVTLPIMLYKTPDKVLFSGLGQNLIEGKEYRLKCTIINVAPPEKLKVIWYKDDKVYRTKEFSETSKIPVKVSTTLSITPTSDYDESVFRCEAVLDFGPDGPETFPTLSPNYTAVVQYKPLFKSCPSHHTVVENTFRLEMLDCQMEGNPIPTVQWYFEGEVFDSSETLTRNNTGKYTVEATNIHGSSNTSVDITVERCPLMLTPPKVVAKFGDPVFAVCNTSATDAVGMGWESPVKGTRFLPPPTVNWTVEKLEDWDLKPDCYITLKDGGQCSVTLPIMLYKTPDKVLFSGLGQNLIEGKEYQLNCTIINVAPPEKLKVIWYKDDKVYRTKEFSETSKIPVNVSTTLNITPSSDYDESVFRCEAVLDFGPDGPETFPTLSPNYTAVVQYKPLFKSCSSHHTVVENTYRLEMLDCQMEGNPIPTVQWYFEGEVFDSSETLTRNNTGKYTVEATNIHGSSNTSVDITVEYAPSFTCDERYKVEFNTHIQSPCKPKGLPNPKLTWFKNGQAKVQWTKHDSGDYEIHATNSLGTAKHKIYLDILYPPEIKEGNGSVEANQGENVTFSCTTEGNPPPQVVWTFIPDATPENITVWRHKTIAITAATSATTGVYSCSATNSVGKVSRTVSLAIKGKSRGPSYTIIWVFIIILIIIALILLAILLYKRQKKHGRYSFIPSKDGSNIPLSTRAAGGSP